MRSRSMSRSHGVRSKDELSASLHFDGPRPSSRPCPKAMPEGHTRRPCVANGGTRRSKRRSAAQRSTAIEDGCGEGGVGGHELMRGAGPGGVCIGGDEYEFVFGYLGF